MIRFSHSANSWQHTACANNQTYWNNCSPEVARRMFDLGAKLWHECDHLPLI